MPRCDESFDALLINLRRGDSSAAEVVFRKFAGPLAYLVRRRLPENLRAKLDPEDVVQSAFHAFFTGSTAGSFRLATWEELWALLATITHRKCSRALNYYRRKARDPRREAPFESASELGERDRFRYTAPEEEAILSETLDQLFRGLSPRDRLILVLALEGQSPLRIADQVGVGRRTAARVLERVRDQLELMRADLYAPGTGRSGWDAAG